DPRAVEPAVPPDLAELCRALLAPEPGDRPSDDEVLRRIDADRDAVGSTLAAAPEPAPEAFLGRERQLAELARAFAALREGTGSAALIGGVSGMGKSALARRFLDDAARTAGALILAGRCY